MEYKRYQVFVSSTYKDLVEERAAVINCLLDNDCIPVGMEQFPAMPLSQWEYIKKLIENSDYYLLIVAGKYGSIDPETGLSFTEKEFRYALEKEIPVIAFLNKNVEELPAEKRESLTQDREKIDKFRKFVLESNRLCDFYTNIYELKYAVAISLRKTIEQFPAEGWVRSSQIHNYQENMIEQLQNVLVTFINAQNEKKSVVTCNLSVEAKTILKAACGESAIILVTRSLSGTSISTEKTIFCNEATSRLETIWTSAIMELEEIGYIDDSTGKKEVFKVTKSGFDYNEKMETLLEYNLLERGYDTIDVAIVNMITDHNQYSVADISNTLGYSSQSIIRRLKKLQNGNVIGLTTEGKRNIWKVMIEK